MARRSIAAAADGTTPLHLAALSGNIEVAQHLLDQGADRSARDFQGQTPYNIAVTYGYQALAKLLEPRELVTPSIYRDGTADIERRIEQMDAALARYRAKTAQDEAQADQGQPATNLPPDNSKALSKEMSTEELLKAAGDLINSSKSPRNAAPSGIDAAVAKDMNRNSPSGLGAPDTGQPLAGANASDPLFADKNPGEADDPLKAADAGATAAMPVGNGNYAIQFVAVRSEDRAQREWTRLTKQYPDLLLTLSGGVTKADLGDKGTFYRLRAGPLTKERATAICQSLAEKNERCLVVKP